MGAGVRIEVHSFARAIVREVSDDKSFFPSRSAGSMRAVGRRSGTVEHQENQRLRIPGMTIASRIRTRGKRTYSTSNHFASRSNVNRRNRLGINVQVGQTRYASAACKERHERMPSAPYIALTRSAEATTPMPENSSRKSTRAVMTMTNRKREMLTIRPHN
jgi:hypothetical protein